jgi:hypothetical protein
MHLTEYDIKILRVLNGEEVEGVIGGAAIWAATSYLRSRGLAAGTYHITEKGREYLRGINEILR